MDNESLRLFFDEVRGKTLQILEWVREPEACVAPAGLQNHILWHAGHSYMTVELLVARGTGRQAEYPAGWYELFSWDSDPAAVAEEAWPSLAEVKSALAAQHKRLLSAMAAVSEEQLQASVNGRPAGWWIAHGIHDEACHSGEMWLLLKMQRARPR